MRKRTLNVIVSMMAENITHACDGNAIKAIEVILLTLEEIRGIDEVISFFDDCLEHADGEFCPCGYHLGNIDPNSDDAIENASIPVSELAHVPKDMTQRPMSTKDIIEVLTDIIKNEQKVISAHEITERVEKLK